MTQFLKKVCHIKQYFITIFVNFQLIYNFMLLLETKKQPLQKYNHRGSIDVIRHDIPGKAPNKRVAHLLLPTILLIYSGGVIAADLTFIFNHFSGSQNCAFCHDGLTDNSGTDVSIAKDWGASMMANATNSSVSYRKCGRRWLDLQ